MQNEQKTIGILTSGGDAPGMNAAIRAVVRAAIERNWRVLGIRRGYKGLLEHDMEGMNLRSVANILQMGGTMLYTSRCPEFMQPESVHRAADICREAGIDALVTIGGDGTFRGALDLSREGIPCIGIPGTIDNDIASSDYTIGFDTAINTVVQMVDRVRDTSRSHDRCCVVEVMGRHAGYIALESGIACGALAIIVPECTTDYDEIAEKMMAALNNGRKNFIIITAEGAAHAHEAAVEIERRTHIQTNEVVLGYVQRGGSPTAMDRTTASAMGYHAVELIERGIENRVIVRQNGVVTDIDITVALGMKKTINPDMLRVATALSI